MDINRGLIVVRPRQPFVDWLNGYEEPGDKTSLDTNPNGSRGTGHSMQIIDDYRRREGGYRHHERPDHLLRHVRHHHHQGGEFRCPHP